jgi:hypothetical protein
MSWGMGAGVTYFTSVDASSVARQARRLSCDIIENVFNWVNPGCVAKTTK